MSALFQKQTWRSAYVSFRRSPRDRRAAQYFVRFVLITLLFFGCLVADLHMVMAQGFEADTRLIIFALIVAVVMVLSVRTAYLHLEERWSDREAIPLVSENVRLALAGQTITLALLLQRAGSEECIAEKQLHRSIEVTTRANGIERLTRHHLYDGLSRECKELFLLPDGHWSEEQRARIFTCWEDFEALRWAMSLSRDLLSIENTPKNGWRDVLRIAGDTERAVQRAKLRPSWDLRPKRDQAKKYLDRCVSRMVTAGMIDAVPENASWQRKMEEIYEQEAHADLLVGHDYIREVDAPTLVWTSHRAARRLEMLSLLTKIASEEAPAAALQLYLSTRMAPPSLLNTNIYAVH